MTKWPEMLNFIFDKSRFMSMTKKQKWQVAFAALFAILFIVWFFYPGWGFVKILGLLANALLALSMLLSYKEEEKRKSKSDK